MCVLSITNQPGRHWYSIITPRREGEGGTGTVPSNLGAIGMVPGQQHWKGTTRTQAGIALQIFRSGRHEHVSIYHYTLCVLLRRHVGDLGNVIQDTNGNVSVTILDHLVSLEGNYSVVGRAIVVSRRFKMVITAHGRTLR